MARVLKNVPVIEKHAVCMEGCGATVAYVPGEVRERKWRDYGDGPAGCRYVVCPGCGKDIILKSW